jgi:hypothetical protein
MRLDGFERIKLFLSAVDPVGGNCVAAIFYLDFGYRIPVAISRNMHQPFGVASLMSISRTLSQYCAISAILEFMSARGLQNTKICVRFMITNFLPIWRLLI